MIKYGIIGIGNCGGQIVNLASKEMKIDGIAINTSDQDLSEVVSDTVKTYLIGDKKGAGQSRTRAKKYLKSDIREITESEDFTKFISGLELIYVVSSMGVTGVRSEIKTDIESIVSSVKEVTDTPTAVGFGINTAEQVHKYSSIADGAIVGSAIVKIVARYGENAGSHIYDYVHEMVAGLAE